MAAAMARRTFGTGQREISTAGWLLRGAAAGAVATTALHAVTYLDMVVRGRGTSSTPEQAVEALANKAHVAIPGDDETRENRVHGLGALMGLAAGVGFGGVVGLVRAAGFRSPPVVRTLLTTLGVLVATNGPMTALGVTDPRTWSSTDWISDLVPHLAYGAVVTATMEAFDRP
jgi:drug/metabolite transporter (DMT)-like permease